LRLRANILGSSVPACYPSPRPRPSSTRRRHTCAGCSSGSDCTESRWVRCGPFFRMTCKPSAARVALPAGRATESRPRPVRNWPHASSANANTPARIDSSGSDDSQTKRDGPHDRLRIGL